MIGLPPAFFCGGRAGVGATGREAGAPPPVPFVAKAGLVPAPVPVPAPAPETHRITPEQCVELARRVCQYL